MTMQDETQDVEAARRRLMNAMRTGVAQDPDALARDRADAERRGVTVQTLRAARAQGLPLPTAEILDLPQTAPRAAEFLSNPANAAVAHDDTDSMSGVETLLRGVGSRAVNLGAGLGRLLFTAVDAPADLLARGTEALGLPSRIDIDRQGTITGFSRATQADYASRVGGVAESNLIRQGQNATLGYQPMTTWEETKQQPLRNFIPFALESGLVSAPDMAAAVFALPAYLAARTGEIGQQRAENNGQVEATVGDLTAALPAAAASSLLERIGTRGIFGLDDVVRGGARGIPAAAGRGALIEAGTEGAQSFVEYAGSNAGTQKGFSFAEALDQSLAGIVAGGTFGGTVRSVTAGIEVTRDHVQRTQRQAAAAEAGGQVVDRLAAIAQASVLRERDPRTFEEFVEHAAQGTQVENVYINAEAFAQAAGPNLPEILATVPEIKEQLDTALASGGDLRISAGAFAAHIAGAEYAQPMLEHLRVDPFDMSRAQAKDFLANQAEELKAEVEQAMAAGQMDEAFQASADKVREGLMTELETAGRFSADVNGAYAAVVTNFYSTMAARTGMTPEQFAAKYPLRVTNEMPGAPRANTMDQQLGEDVDLVHFSPLPDLEQSDPMAWGRNAVATTRDERQRVPLASKPDWMTDEQFAAANARRGPGRTYFYDRAVRGDRPEASIGVTSPNAYRATIKRSRLYDLDADPQNLRDTGPDLTTSEGIDASWDSLGLEKRDMEEANGGRGLPDDATYNALVQATSPVGILATRNGRSKAADGLKAALREGRRDIARLIVARALAAVNRSRGENGGADANDMMKAALAQDERAFLDILDELPNDNADLGDGWRLEDGEKLVRETLTPGERASLYEQAIKDAGFAGYVSNDRGVLGGVAVFEPLPLQRSTPVEFAAPLPGAPKTNSPNATARRAAEDYMASAGMAYNPPDRYVRVNPETAEKIADAFEAMKHDPSDPTVAAAYDAMIRETLAQWEAIKKTGLKVEFIKDSDPYAKSPRMALDDVRENNHLWVFPTDQGFGSSDLDVSDNPLLRKTGEVLDGRELVANDVFRIVHDYFGHIKDGNGFRADGEENAWRSHAAMYSPLARRAMTTETRGQNSWVNYGPHAEANRKASASETVYADQKIGLLPEWVSEEGATYNQSDVFYSALERAVANSPTTKAPAAQWKATLAKTPGVKKEEIEWSGLNEWLDLAVPFSDPDRSPELDERRAEVAAKRPITREAVLEFLRAGGVRVEERLLGFVPDTSGRYITPSEDGEGYDLLDAQGNLIQSFEDEGEAEWTLNGGETPAQFSTYKLPGADDTYRELLLTLPNIEGPSTHWDEPNVIAHTRFTERQDADGKRVLFLEELQSDWHQKGRDEGYETPTTPEQVAAAEQALEDARLALVAAEQAVLPTAERVINARLDFYEKKLAELEAAGATELAGQDLRDVVKLEERQTLQEYRRVERQLDIHQDLLNAVDSTSGERRNRAAVQAAFNAPSWGPNVDLPMPTEAERAASGHIAAGLRYYEAQVAFDGIEGGGIPDAPFRTSWSALVMKRMIRYAADNGYDKIAWINGNQQNGGQTGGDGSFFYERNLVNTTNDLLKKYGARVEPVDFRDQGEATNNEIHNRAVDRINAGEDIGTPTQNEIMDRRARPATALGIQNGFTITPELAAAARQGFALFQPNRGQIAFGPDITQSPSVISLLRTADLSTFLHETGHFFLEVTAHVANQPDAPAEIVADFTTTLQWFRPGMTMSEWNAMSLEQRRPYHEQWARGFEAYLFEGKSPSPAMRGIFRRFSAWLKNVYKSLAALNVELTDEVRSVMDRMVASADDIRVAEQARSFAPMMATKPETMTEDEWTRYQELGVDATQEAIETLESRNLRDMQWASNAKSKYLRALQREAEEQRKVVRAEVTAEVMAEPVNRARTFLRRGLGEDGQPVEGASKLDLDALKAQYGEDHPWTQLRRGGKYGEVAKDGVLPDVMADMFGFPTGEALIDALVNAENPRDKIAGLTDQRMLERYGDLSSPEALERAANEAVANDARLKFVAAEAAATAKAVGKKAVLNEAAKTYAASVVNRLILKRLRPGQYLAAQGRAAKEAEAAYRKGDIAGAATAKRNQLINLHVGKAVQDAQKDVEKSMRLFKRIVSAKDDALGKSRDMNIVNAARAILAMYGVGRVKNDPASYMKLLATYDPVLYADLEPFVSGASGDAKPMTEISYEQFVAMRDTVASLWVMAKRTRQMEIDGQLVDIKTAADALNMRMDEIGIPTNVPGSQRAVTDKERQGRSLLGIRAALRRVESWARGMDGADQGPFRKFIWNVISEASDRYRSESAVYVRRFRDLLDTVRDELKPYDIKAPEIGYTFGGKAELYHALLHTGNGSNKSKLLLGRKWGKRTADGDLDSSRWDAFVDRLHAEGVLTEKDWTFVQAVWDLLEETKPGAQKAHRHIYGRYFDEIAADPVATPFGVLRGGYVPALTDAFLVQDAAIRAEQEAVEGGDSAMFPAASNGFTKSRVEDYTRELALDLRLLTMHIDKVLKFTHLGPPVRDVMRLMKNRSFAATLAAVDPTAQKDMLLPWLQRAAKQLVETASKGDAGKATDRFFSAVRSRVGMQLMFANVVNTAQQVTGFSNVLLRVPAPALGHALWRFVRDPKKVSAEAADISEFLRNRMTSDIFEARQAIKQLTKLDPSKKDEVVDFLTRHAYFMQSAVQNVMDVVSWTAAFDHATARGDSPTEVVRFADSVIRETQGSMAPEDVSRFETGLPIQRLFTQFAGYFNMMANLNATEVQHVARDVGLRKGAGRLFYVYLMGFAIPALVGDAIAKGLRGGWEDEDGDGYLDDLIAWFFSSQARFGLAMVPVVGQVGNALIGTTTGQPYDDRISLSPAVSVIESTVPVPREVYEAITGKEDFNRGDTRNTLNLLGILTGTPAGVLAKPAGYGVGVAQGDIEPTGPVDAVRGAITGAPSPDSKVD